jgi:hypothetical protein
MDQYNSVRVQTWQSREVKFFLYFRAELASDCFSKKTLIVELDRSITSGENKYTGILSRIVIAFTRKVSS